MRCQSVWLSSFFFCYLFKLKPKLIGIVNFFEREVLSKKKVSANLHYFTFLMETIGKFIGWQTMKKFDEIVLEW